MEEVFAGKQTPKLRAALDQLIAEARGHLKTAFALLANAPPEVRPVFLPLALVRRDLERMSRADNDPFVPQVSVAVADAVDVVAGVAVAGVFVGRARKRIQYADALLD